MKESKSERSLGDLFAELSQKTSLLVKKEIELARHEMTRSATEMARRSTTIGVGAVIAYAGFIVLLFGAGWLLAELGLPLWVGLVLAGAVALIVGGLLAYSGVQALKKVSVVPERTVETIKQDVEWAKEQTQ